MICDAVAEALTSRDKRHFQVPIPRLLALAEQHGLGGVLLDEFDEAVVPANHPARLREIARELDHEAALRLLQEIDEAFSAAEVEAVALKGVAFAQRYYPRPSARPTSDLDVLVAESDVERALSALRAIGFREGTGEREARFRAEHHHLHLHRADVITLELHFHAYRGLGSTLRGELLIARRETFRTLRSVGVLEPIDEFVYLAVHAAAHRFVRLGWLYDLKLLLPALRPADRQVARQRAEDWGYGRALAYAASLLVEFLRIPAPELEAFGQLSETRRRIVDRVVREPQGRVARSLTRLVYGVGIAADARAAARFVGATLSQGVRRALRPTET